MYSRKNGRGAKTAQQEWWGGMQCPGTLGQEGEIIVFWQKLIGVLLKLKLPKVLEECDQAPR